eukprot:evm.model.scf_147.7 EVM.evm.TU.scf_147.7   scf_147:68147-71798(+)
MAPAPHQVFPLVVPCNGSLTCYEGFVTLPEDSVDCTNLWLRLSNVSKGQAPLKGAKFDCSPEMGAALRGYEWLVRKRLADASSVAQFFMELKEMLQTHVKQRLVALLWGELVSSPEVVNMHCDEQLCVCEIGRPSLKSRLGVPSR